MSYERHKNYCSLHKLWDGRLQLNASLFVSAVAFFKSGEKFPSTKWPDFIEVKGKVKLEAFEVYVKDLQRSHNRGLMVISLCGKEGSSEREFIGIKEFSDRYRKEERVGLAELSVGASRATLYICPCSDTIINILAKYNFLKGVVGIEDNQNSLIGCVVWRKSQFSSNSVTNTSESQCESSLDQPMVSVSGSSTHQVAGNGDRIKKIQSSNVQLKIIHSSAAGTVPPTSSVRHGPYQASSGPFLDVEASHSGISGIKRSKMRLYDENAAISVQSNVKKIILPTDEDDLPQFDFEVECGVSATALSKHEDSSILDMELQAEGSCKQDGGSVSTTTAVVHALSFPTQGLNDSDVYKYNSAPYQGMPQPKVVLERPCENPPNHNMEEQCGAQSMIIPTPPTAATLVTTKNSCDMLNKKSKLFDDDNDLPEWCPSEPYKHSLEETNGSSATLPPKLPNPSFKHISLVGPRPVILPRAPSSIHYQFSYRPYCPAVELPPTISSGSPRTMSMQSSSSFSSRIDSTQALRSQSSSLDVRPPHQLPGRKDWWSAH